MFDFLISFSPSTKKTWPSLFASRKCPWPKLGLTRPCGQPQEPGMGHSPKCEQQVTGWHGRCWGGCGILNNMVTKFEVSQIVVRVYKKYCGCVVKGSKSTKWGGYRMGQDFVQETSFFSMVCSKTKQWILRLLKQDCDPFRSCHTWSCSTLWLHSPIVMVPVNHTNTIPTLFKCSLDSTVHTLSSFSSMSFGYL